jgi:hypothetical protein
MFCYGSVAHRRRAAHRTAAIARIHQDALRSFLKPILGFTKMSNDGDGIRAVETVCDDDHHYTIVGEGYVYNEV